MEKQIRGAIFICWKEDMKDFLTGQGIAYKNERQDRYDETKKIWVFRNTPELERALRAYFETFYK